MSFCAWFSVTIVIVTLCIACDAGFADKKLREKWEVQFYQICAQPVLQDVHKHHRQALDLIATDNSQGSLIIVFTESTVSTMALSL